MSQFFQFVGAFVVCGAVAAVILFFGLKWWLKNKLLKPFMDAAAQAGSFEMSPEMELNRIEAVFSNPESIARIEAELEALGYSRIGDFETRAMPVLLRAFFHPNHSFAVAYEHTAVTEPWVDFWTSFEDGQQLTVTNAPSGEEVQGPPWSSKIYVKHAKIGALYERFVEASAGRNPDTSLSADSFEESFCDAYDRWVRWRAEAGGVRRAEILHHDPDLTNEELERAEGIFEAQNERMKREIERRDELNGRHDVPPKGD